MITNTSQIKQLIKEVNERNEHLLVTSKSE